MTRRLLALACAVLLLESLLGSVLTPLVPSYRRELGLTDGATGILLASYSLGGLLLSLPAGWFASRFSPRSAVVLGLLGVGVSSALFGFAGRVSVLDGSRFLLGAFGALMWTGGIAWMISAAPVPRRGQVMGTLMAASVAGELVGAPLGALADDVGTEIVFGAMLLVCAGLALLTLTLPPAAEAAGQSIREALGIMRTAGLRRFVDVVLAVAAPSLATGLTMVLVPLRFDDLGVSAWWVAGAFTVMSLIQVVLGPLAGRASDRMGRMRPYVVGLAVCGVALVAMGAFAHLWAVLVSLLAFSVGAGFAFPPCFTMATDLATEAGLNQGYASALSSISWSGSLIIGAIGGGLLIGASGYLLSALVMTILLAFAGWLARAADVPLPMTHGPAAA